MGKRGRPLAGAAAAAAARRENSGSAAAGAAGAGGGGAAAGGGAGGGGGGAGAGGGAAAARAAAARAAAAGVPHPPGSVPLGSPIIATPANLFGRPSRPPPKQIRRMAKLVANEEAQSWKEKEQAQGAQTSASADQTEDTMPLYTQLACPPSTYPPKRYCDVTGFPAKYTDPATKIRYARANNYTAIRNMPKETADAWLALRGDVSNRLR